MPGAAAQEFEELLPYALFSKRIPWADMRRAPELLAQVMSSAFLDRSPPPPSCLCRCFRFKPLPAHPVGANAGPAGSGHVVGVPSCSARLVCAGVSDLNRFSKRIPWADMGKVPELLAQLILSAYPLNSGPHPSTLAAALGSHYTMRLFLASPASSQRSNSSA